VGAGFFLVVVMPIFLDFFIGYKPDIPEVPLSIDYSSSDGPASTQPAVWPEDAPGVVAEFPTDPAQAPSGALWVNQTAHELRVRIGGKTYTVGQIREPGRQRLKPMIRIQGYLISMLQMAAAFGLGFQVPVIVALLATIGIASSSDMARVRKYVWFGIAVIAALITPSPDVTSMMLLFIPMVLLYEAGLMAARVIEREGGSGASG
jgi:Sec-independent protein secretion pathway component TatC